jgi:hypothetical protein
MGRETSPMLATASDSPTPEGEGVGCVDSGATRGRPQRRPRGRGLPRAARGGPQPQGIPAPLRAPLGGRAASGRAVAPPPGGQGRRWHGCVARARTWHKVAQQHARDHRQQDPQGQEPVEPGQRGRRRWRRRRRAPRRIIDKRDLAAPADAVAASINDRACDVDAGERLRWAPSAAAVRVRGGVGAKGARALARARGAGAGRPRRGGPRVDAGRLAPHTQRSVAPGGAAARRRTWGTRQCASPPAVRQASAVAPPTRHWRPASRPGSHGPQLTSTVSSDPRLPPGRAIL